MKFYVGCALFLFTACASGPRVLSMNGFFDVMIGSTREEVIAEAGQPYLKEKKSDGTEEWQYIERLNAGNRLLQETRYTIVIKDNVVISKRVQKSSPHPMTFDSYEMQTTQNGTSEDKSL